MTEDEVKRCVRYSKHPEVILDYPQSISDAISAFEKDMNHPFDKYSPNSCCYAYVDDDCFTITVLISSSHGGTRGMARTYAIVSDETLRDYIRMVESIPGLQEIIAERKHNDESIIYDENKKTAYVIITRNNYTLIKTVVNKEPFPFGHMTYDKGDTVVYVTQSKLCDAEIAAKYFSLKTEK